MEMCPLSCISNFLNFITKMDGLIFVLLIYLFNFDQVLFHLDVILNSLF